MSFIRAEIKNSKWKISKHEFYTAYHFAMQYNEWKDTVRGMIGLSAVVTDGMPHGNTISDPTSQQAMKLSELQRKIDIVESIAKETDEQLYCWLLKGVTCEEITFAYLQTVMNIPCSKNTYYDRRRKFYYLLSKKIEVN